MEKKGLKEKTKSDKEENKKFGKEILKTYMDSRCERRLFLALSRESPEWRKPLEKIKKNFRGVPAPQLVQTLGHEYEQKVYSQVMAFAKCITTTDPQTHQVETYDLYTKSFITAYNRIQKSQSTSFFLLEGEFNIPWSIKHHIFKQKTKLSPGSKFKIPVQFSDLRPDILLIQKVAPQSQTKLQQSNLELLPYGKTRQITEEERQSRLSISVIDVKQSHEQKVGKSFFLEIYYYMLNLAHFLHDHKLSQYYYISLENNGIFPKYTDEDLKTMTNKTNFLEKVILIQWKETQRAYNRIIKVVQSLWSQTPCSHYQIPLNINRKCGYCMYLENCMASLGKTEGSNPGNWGIELIPYTSNSIIEQLKSLNFHTVNDVANRINTIKIGNTPQPIYTEIPLLKIKSRALQQNAIIYPDPGDIHSYTIPKFSPMALTFTIENDPLNEQVFGYGLLLYLSIHPKSPLFLIFENWWKTWKKALTDKLSLAEIEMILMDRGFIKEKAIPINKISKIHKILTSMYEYDALKIYLKGEKNKEGEKYSSTYVTFRTARINQTMADPESEAELARNLIRELYQIFELSHVIEEHITDLREKEFKKKKYYYTIRPNMGVYYWGRDQLEHLQEMLERNLPYIMNSPQLLNQFTQITSWFSPIDSEVTHPYQHKKIYDLQKFIETAVGFPAVINYTWHNIAKIVKDKKFSNMYWIDHFNYMDYNVWYRYLETKRSEQIEKEKLEQNPVDENANKIAKEKKDLKNKVPKDPKDQGKTEDKKPKTASYREEVIKNQLGTKVININSLRMFYQSKAREIIAKNSKPFRIEDFIKKDIPTSFHSIANVWYFFSKLTGTMQEFEAEYFRTMFPEYSIGKLVAAEVSDLQTIPTINGKYEYFFHLKGLSSNMKLHAGDHVLLIPDQLRDMNIGPWTRKWVVIIKKMIWEEKVQGYSVITEEIKLDLKEQLKVEVEHPKPEQDQEWYLYDYPSDSWSQKLYGLKVGGLLERWNFGRSWLGTRLAYLWDIKSQKTINYPSSLNVMTPELYLYAPQLIQTTQTNNNVFESKIAPHPDKSQENAILESLQHTLYAIQGPPGTGKSQTIAALVNEFLYRKQQKNEPARILITAFSYAAIRVMIDKIRKSQHPNGKPSDVASIQQVFLRSDSQDPIADEKNLRHVDDLVRIKSKTWRWNHQKKVVTETKPVEYQLEDNYIFYGNAHQLFRLTERTLADFAFDLIIVDEASQLPTDYFMASLQFVKKFSYQINGKSDDFTQYSSTDAIQNQNSVNDLIITDTIDYDDLTKVIIVGDYNQLPPVQPVEPPKNLELVLDSLFSYYVKNHHISSSQLKVNYRSNEDIVQFTSLLGLYENLTAHSLNAKKTLSGDLSQVKCDWCKAILNPELVIATVIHHSEYEIAVSVIEAEIVAHLVTEFYRMKKPTTILEENHFWQELVGVISPHNAQGRVIIHKIYESMTNPADRMTQYPNNSEGKDLLMKNLTSTVYSVEKFQGSDRELIIASVGISDIDQLTAENEFIYDLNRFNVLTSRAKRKIILVCSEGYLNFIPSDREIMVQAFQSHRFAISYCNKEQVLFIKTADKSQNYILLRGKDNTDSIDELCSAFQIHGTITNPHFLIHFSSNPQMSTQISALPAKFSKEQIENDEEQNGFETWKFELKDTEEIHNYIPLPDNILKEYAQMQLKTISKPKKETKKLSKPKKVEKLKIKFGDSDDQSLF